MTNKRFFFLFLVFFLAVTAFNVTVWNLATRELLACRDGYCPGDLSRIGYITEVLVPKRFFVDLPRRHFDYRLWKGERVDVLTVGDSFSFGGGRSRNAFYQDYIASLHNLNVLNIPIYREDPVATVILLLNNGWLDRIKPRYILIEAVERSCIGGFAREMDFTASEPMEKIDRDYRRRIYDYETTLPVVGFVNDGNFKYVLYRLLYPFSDNAIFSKVYKVKLDRPLFSAGDGRILIFGAFDLLDLPKSNDATIGKLNENLNRLAGMLKERNIRLLFMPAPDKYNLYRDYLAEKKYPESRFFELLRAMPKGYGFIDTKRILGEELKKGTVDLYHPDDSHWSCKASERIFREWRFDDR
ncbi:MAG: hypothetical protein CVU61_06610 [Deltaproteobacteria bacterium HGW-Deltaproteobacteria-19]|jgi:hypothetical protein|nr:MAG: hypothetical protein CVU61_06610 [Deltaproteobacteria bacterium HGW-Deltaproteobacteria-19]